MATFCRSPRKRARRFPRTPGQGAAGAGDRCCSSALELLRVCVSNASKTAASSLLAFPVFPSGHLLWRYQFSFVTALLSPGPAHGSGHCLLCCQNYFLCAHPDFLFLQTHPVHHFLKDTFFPSMSLLFVIRQRDPSSHRTEYITARPMWQINPFTTWATIRNRAAICMMLLHQTNVYTHTNHIYKCLLRGRWDQRALLTHTTLWSCNLSGSKIIEG